MKYVYAAVFEAADEGGYAADKGIPLPCASGIGDIAAPEHGFVNLVAGIAGCACRKSEDVKGGLPVK